MFHRQGILCFILAAALAPAANATSVKPQPIEVKWLIAHEPIDAFKRAAKIFADELVKESHGEMTLKVLTPKHFNTQTENMTVKQIFSLLGNGEVQLSQTLTTGIGSIEPKFFVLDLPFLFKNDESAQKVLDGPIGQKLLASLDKSMVRGLAFTYSGGFRVVPSSARAITSWTDFKGLKVRTSNSPIAQETLRVLGATPVPTFIGDAKGALESGRVEAAETTYVRIQAVAGDNTNFINETHHSLFLTSILASAKFYNSLTPQNQIALQKAAFAAAKMERQDSVADGERLKAEYAKKGVKIVALSAAARSQMAERLQSVYRKFEPIVGKDLIRDISTAQQ